MMMAKSNLAIPRPDEATANPDASLHERLRSRLVCLVEDLEDGEIPPTDLATERCRAILMAAAERLPPGRTLSFPHLATAGEGDLSCEWRRFEKRVLLFISALGESTLYLLTLADTPVVARDT